MGVKAPANRQAASRWIQDSESGKSRLSAYMNDALSFADRNAHIIIAFDLADAISEDDARSRLLAAEGLRASDIEGLALAASRLQGVTLGVTIRESIVGSLRIDFKPGTEGLDRVKKELIIDILSNRGLMVDDVLDWELTVEASRLVLRGPLKPAGLRQISLLINQPVRVQLTETSPGNEQAEKEISVGKATRHYIDTLTLFLNELDEFVQNPRHKHANVYARWFDKYANKLDMLSVSSIDPDMLTTGSQISAGFREVSQLLTSAEASTRSRETTERGGVYWSGNGYGGGYGYGYGYGYRRTNASVKQAIRTQETAEAASQSKVYMEKLRDLLGDSRRQMSVKYPQDF